MDKNIILVVDDDTSNLMELTHILKTDYKVYAVKDGSSAIKNANLYMPDVILLDVIMPDVSGYDVISELKKTEKTKDIPVIFITGMKDNVSEIEGYKLGAVDYLRKPFDSEIVIFKITRELEILNLRRKLKEALDKPENK